MRCKFHTESDKCPLGGREHLWLGGKSLGYLLGEQQPTVLLLHRIYMGKTLTLTYYFYMIL